MIRDWKDINRYYTELLDDVYAQPEDTGTTELAETIINKWVTKLDGVTNVLDVGCGEGFCQPFFERLGIAYTGIALGNDCYVAKEKGRNVLHMDMNFLDFPDKSFDLIFSRHSLEHSPFPLITLMEFHRVARQWMLLVLPSPAIYSWTCPNHFGIMTKSMAITLMDRAGWGIVWEDFTEEIEYRFFAQKQSRFVKHSDHFDLCEEEPDADQSGV